MAIKRLSCPNCHSTQLDRDEIGNIVCESCGTILEVARDELICNSCETVNPAHARRCMNCGSALGRVCAVCQHHNHPGADHCHECGTPLDTFSAVASRVGEGVHEVRRQREKSLLKSKASDNTYLLQERERLNQEQEARMDDIREKRASDLKRQRTLILWITLAGVIAFLMIASSIFLLSR